MPSAPADMLELARMMMPRAGYLSAMDCREVGVAAIGLSGGRRKTSDVIDLAVGFSGFRSLGAKLEAGEPICLVHARTEMQADTAIAALDAAIRIADEAPPQQRVVSARITDAAP